MAFLNTVLLWGSALASIPVIIHLIRKNRVKEMEWAAMDFLFDVVEEQKKRFQMEDILLLLLRTLLILFLVLAMARPVLSSAGFGFGKRDTLIAMDDTFSMATRSGSKTRFDHAVDVASGVVSRIPGSSGGALVLQRSNAEKVIGTLSADHSLLGEAVRSLSVSDYDGDPAAGLKACLDIIEKEKTPGAVVYLISDFQESEWKEPSADVKEVLKKLREKTDVIFVNVGDSEESNISVVELQPLQAAVRVGEPIWFSVKIRNNGKDDTTDVPVYFEINGAVREALSVSIPAGQTTSTVFQADVESAGFHKATVRIGIDNNEKDNFAFTQFEAFEQLKVLVLQNFIPETIEEKRAVFVDFALNPYPGASQAENALYKFTWNSIQSMSVDDLDEYAFIILDDVRALTTVESKFLEDYVASGGGVMVNMGPTIDAENYNRIFYKDGKGLFAWPLLDTAVEALEEGKYLNYEVNNPNHEIWSFTGGKEVNLGMRLKKCFGFVSQTSDRALSLMKLRSEGDDRSFMAAFTYGRGRVFVNGTSSGLEWNNLALLPTFLPFYRKVSNWLMNEKYGQKKYEVGQSYTQEVSEEKSRTQFEMMAPSGSMQTIEATISGDRHFLNVESLKESGVYKLREEGKSNSRLISVNVDSMESQVTSMANDDLKTIYEPLGVKVTNKQGAATMTSSAAASEISTLLLILAILCWLGENFLSLMISRRGQNG